jgi:Fic family protein
VNSESNGGERQSVASPPIIERNQFEVAKLEASNGLRQFDAVVELVEQSIAANQRFRLRPSTLLHLNRIALDSINQYAGNYRPAHIYIQGSTHEPPTVELVPELTEELCDYVNDNFAARPALHLAAYVMWRINWIHPFADGNGRTTRAASYLVLCAHLKSRLPGKPTIPELIAQKKQDYYRALEAADRAWADGRVDLAELEKLLESGLSAQLVSTVEQARGQPLSN